MDNIQKAVSEQLAQFEEIKNKVKAGDSLIQDLMSEVEKMDLATDDSPIIDEGVLSGGQKLEYRQTVSQYRDDEDDFRSGPIMA